MTLTQRAAVSIALGIALALVGILGLFQGARMIGTLLPILFIVLMGLVDDEGWSSDCIPLVAVWTAAGWVAGGILGFFITGPANLRTDDLGAVMAFVVALFARGKPHPSVWTWPLLLWGWPESPERFARHALADVLDALPHLADPKVRAEAAETPLWAFAVQSGQLMDGSRFANPIGPWAMVFEQPSRQRILAVKWDGLPFRLTRTIDDQAVAQAILDRRIVALGARGLTADSRFHRVGWNKIGIMPPPLDATAHARLAWRQSLRD